MKANGIRLSRLITWVLRVYLGRDINDHSLGMDRIEEGLGIGIEIVDVQGVLEEDLEDSKVIPEDFHKIETLDKEHKVAGILTKEVQDIFHPRIGVFIVEKGLDLGIELKEKILGDVLGVDAKHVKA